MKNNYHPKRKDTAILSRMSRGLAACAECKRMKLKCDKKVPCSSCVRRECSSICPTGVLISRQASRAILAGGRSARRTQDDIAQLRERNLKLEDALAFAYSHTSKDTHPLLAESSPRQRPKDDSEVDKIADVLGTLTVGEAGELKYFGPSSMVEVLIKAFFSPAKSLTPTQSLHQATSTADKPPLSSSPLPTLDHTLGSLSAKTPLDFTRNMESFVSTILNDLPERARAWSLCDILYKTYPIYSMPIQEEELMESYIFPMYKYLEDSHTAQNLPLSSRAFRPHRCATIFFVFAIAAWLDVTNQQYWVEAGRYYQIGLSCLSMQSIFYSPEVASVNALCLLAYYNELQGAAPTSTMSPGWTILSLACKIGQGLGLHRDPAQWNLDNTTIHRRRWLYWELISMEVFHCLGTGRPLNCRPSYVDTELPDDMGQTDARGQHLQGFFRCKHEFVRDCYLDVVETLVGATPATYEMILELDRKVREKEIPGHLNRIIVNAEDGPSLTAPEFLHTCMLGIARSIVILSIHRGHLTEALQHSSGNPLKSRYAPSFLASFRAASWVVKSYHAAHKRFPVLFARLWNPWTAVLVAVMVLGSIAIDAPSSLIGNSPLEELRVASSMFDDAAARTVSHRTKNGAKIVQKILARAEEAQARHSITRGDDTEPGISMPPTNYGDDELAIFGGQTRLSPINTRQTHLQSQEGASSHDSDSSASSPGLLEEHYPSLAEFLNTAPMTQVASSTTFQEIQGSALRSLAVSPFHDPEFSLPQLGGWVPSSLPTSHKHYHFENLGGPSTSGSPNPDTFENYLTSPPPIDLGPQPSTVTPWQDFMMQHSLT
ncbi:hypothetical protein DL96DRAFT_1817038 [Flagelloscypha sp. PMI_526]|nr:hypothetical protein DL96DRAFT_1817038 [Flagelloscypha sp. PMI_526]